MVAMRTSTPVSIKVIIIDGPWEGVAKVMALVAAVTGPVRDSQVIRCHPDTYLLQSYRLAGPVERKVKDELEKQRAEKKQRTH